jgi:hypothetical protein
MFAVMFLLYLVCVQDQVTATVQVCGQWHSSVLVVQHYVYCPEQQLYPEDQNLHLSLVHLHLLLHQLLVL